MSQNSESNSSQPQSPEIQKQFKLKKQNSIINAEQQSPLNFNQSKNNSQEIQTEENNRVQKKFILKNNNSIKIDAYDLIKQKKNSEDLLNGETDKLSIQTKSQYNGMKIVDIGSSQFLDQGTFKAIKTKNDNILQQISQKNDVEIKDIQESEEQEENQKRQLFQAFEPKVRKSLNIGEQYMKAFIQKKNESQVQCQNLKEQLHKLEEEKVLRSLDIQNAKRKQYFQNIKQEGLKFLDQKKQIQQKIKEQKVNNNMESFMRSIPKAFLNGWDKIHHLTIQIQIYQLISEYKMNSKKLTANYKQIEHQIQILNAIKILKKAKFLRSMDDLEYMKAAIEHSAFFKSLQDKYSDNEIIYECLKNMEYEWKSSGTPLFYQGDPGDKFYILLEGSVAIIVTQFKESGLKLYEINSLHSGVAFGDQALSHENNKRNATIITKSDCHFGILQKKNYIRILGENRQLVLNKKIQYFMTLRLFGQLRRAQVVQMVQYNVNDKFYDYGSVVFNEGDDAQMIYIIKQGQFKIVKKTSIEKNYEQYYKTSQQSEDYVPKYSQNKYFKELDIQILGEDMVIQVQKQNQIKSYYDLLNQLKIIGEYEAKNEIKREFKLVCQQNDSLLLSIDYQQLKGIISQHDLDIFLQQAEIQRQWRLNQFEKMKQNIQQNKNYLIVGKVFKDEKIEFQASQEQEKVKIDSQIQKNFKELKNKTFNHKAEQKINKMNESLIQDNRQVTKKKYFRMKTLESQALDTTNDFLSKYQNIPKLEQKQIDKIDKNKQKIINSSKMKFPDLNDSQMINKRQQLLADLIQNQKDNNPEFNKKPMEHIQEQILQDKQMSLKLKPKRIINKSVDLNQNNLSINNYTSNNASFSENRAISNTKNSEQFNMSNVSKISSVIKKIYKKVEIISKSEFEKQSESSNNKSRLQDLLRLQTSNKVTSYLKYKSKDNSPQKYWDNKKQIKIEQKQI